MSKPQLKCKVWDTFLRIPDANTTDEVPVADEKWFEAKGVYSSAPVVLRLIREEVTPLVAKLVSAGKIVGYFFLVHDRESGVPTTVTDKGAYIHMRLYFGKPTSQVGVERLLFDNWEMTKPIYEESVEIAGIDRKFVREENADAIREILKKQSELVLQIVGTYTDDIDDIEPLALIGQVRQNLHYIANMCQIKLVG